MSACSHIREYTETASTNQSRDRQAAALRGATNVDAVTHALANHVAITGAAAERERSERQSTLTLPRAPSPSEK